MKKGGSASASSASVEEGGWGKGFWRPSTVRDVVEERVAEKDAVGPGGVVVNQFRHLPLAAQRTALPIYQNRMEILYLIENFPVSIIIAHTASGKSTQIPQYLFESGYCVGGRMACVTQPRRLACQTLTARVADEMGGSVGEEVGYCLRFDERYDAAMTRILYVTEGMLLKFLLADPLLSRFSVVMIDEAHEHSLYSEILLSLLKKLQKTRRNDLRIVISSATLDPEIFIRFFGKSKCGVMTLKNTRHFPIDVHFLASPVNNYLTFSVKTVFEIHEKEGGGDILVFLTGSEEIDEAVEMVNDNAKTNRDNLFITALPLYVALSSDQQLAVFDPPPTSRTRKVIFSTNISQTSLTIPNIKFVVDSGFQKIKIFDPLLQCESLVVTPISKSDARQRGGRAGRTAPGKAYRLYTEEAFQQLADNPIPEVQRTDLSLVLLQLKALGIDDVVHFGFVSPPSVDAMARGLETLYSLGAIDKEGILTRVGRIFCEFSCDPKMTRILIDSGGGWGAEDGEREKQALNEIVRESERRYNNNNNNDNSNEKDGNGMKKVVCSEEILSICAVLSAPPIFANERASDVKEPARRKYFSKWGDLITMLNVYNAYQSQKPSEVSQFCRHHALNLKSLISAERIRRNYLWQMKRLKLSIGSVFDKSNDNHNDTTTTTGEDNEMKDVGGGGGGGGKRAALREEERKLDEKMEIIVRIIAAGYFGNAAKRRLDGTYATVRGDLPVSFHNMSVLNLEPPPFLLFYEVTEKQSKLVIRELTAVKQWWLGDIA